MPTVVGVQFKTVTKVYHFDSNGLLDLAAQDFVVVDTARGPEVAQIVQPPHQIADDQVIGGTINGQGSFVMRAETVGRDTMLAQIVRMVSEAQRSRAPIQRLADVVAGWFVPAVIVTDILAFAAWSMWGPEPRYAFGLVAAVAVLIIACPCALGLATPMSIMVGVGRGAQAGVLIRDAEALERMEKIDTLVVDKTGTLTEGKPSVTSIATVKDQDENELLALAASVEKASEHPLADAIVPGVAFAQAIGRWGNWFNQELFGSPTDLPWGLTIDPANRPSGFAQYETFHPTFLYESIGNLINFGIIPLTFKSEADYDQVEQGDELEIPEIRRIIQTGGELVVKNKTKGTQFSVAYSLSERQKATILAGGTLALMGKAK